MTDQISPSSHTNAADCTSEVRSAWARPVLRPLMIASETLGGVLNGYDGYCGS